MWDVSDQREKMSYSEDTTDLAKRDIILKFDGGRPGFAIDMISASRNFLLDRKVRP